MHANHTTTAGRSQLKRARATQHGDCAQNVHSDSATHVTKHGSSVARVSLARDRRRNRNRNRNSARGWRSVHVRKVACAHSRPLTYKTYTTRLFGLGGALSHARRATHTRVDRQSRGFFYACVALVAGAPTRPVHKNDPFRLYEERAVLDMRKRAGLESHLGASTCRQKWGELHPL